MAILPETKKTPEDVFVKINQLSDLLDKLSSRLKLSPTSRLKRENQKAIPAEVFLQSGNTLDALIAIMNKLEPGRQWGNYYKTNSKSKPRTPTEVYALADLMLRRLAVVTH